MCHFKQRFLDFPTFNKITGDTSVNLQNDSKIPTIFCFVLFCFSPSGRDELWVSNSRQFNTSRQLINIKPQTPPKEGRTNTAVEIPQTHFSSDANVHPKPKPERRIKLRVTA